MVLLHSDGGETQSYHIKIDSSAILIRTILLFSGRHICEVSHY